ncbi:MAG: c-type cytochrome [Gammaproteobacteria bacterium]
MSFGGAALAALLTASAAASGLGASVDAAAPGQQDYLQLCAGCHGAGGRGDGPRVETLATHPPDLTQLAAANGGSFPETLVYQVIDGRRIVRSHGTTTMPVWGEELARGGASESDIERRVGALIGHIESLQQPLHR